MYIPVIKNHAAELRAIRKLRDAGCINQDLIPLVEIVRKDVEMDQLVDSGTGEPVMEEVPYKSGKKVGQLHKVAIKDPKTKRDVTLRNISGLLPGHPLFVEFFRCDLSMYKNSDHSKCSSVIELNNDLRKYREAIKSVMSFPNLIPVIAIKAGVDKLSPAELVELSHELKCDGNGRPIAIRIDDVSGYEDAISESLSSDDCLLFDVGEAPVVSKEEDFEELDDVTTAARRILICSPRKRDVGNGDFGQTYQIDNKHLAVFKQYGFDGVGDYAGHCDRLIRKGGAGNIGHALAVMYDGSNNSFKYYLEPNSQLGTHGYGLVVARILADRAYLEQWSGECIVLNEIAEAHKRKSHGNWSTWITHTIVRYIHQLYIRQNAYNF